jgi:hypothetical protein
MAQVYLSQLVAAEIELGQFSQQADIDKGKIVFAEAQQNQIGQGGNIYLFYPIVLQR